ncbi:MAG TPA: hypothetical protein VFA97_09440 [Gaiellaceae bacterium]|nr:hypothetical protein [Gaiellaceae bacterium]
MKFDASRLSRLDWGIAGGAAVAFISAFLPWWGYSGPVNILNASVSGWSAGFWAWAGVLLVTLAGVFLVLRRMETSLPELPVGPALLTAGLAALGTVFILIRWVSLPSAHGLGGSVGAKYGLFLGLIAAIVATACAVIELRESGEALPWAQGTSSPAEPAAPPVDPTPPEVSSTGEV